MADASWYGDKPAWLCLADWIHSKHNSKSVYMILKVSGTLHYLSFSPTTDTPGILWKFIVGGIIMIFGLPLFGVTGASLYSKLLPQKIQGIYIQITLC